MSRYRLFGVADPNKDRPNPKILYGIEDTIDGDREFCDDYEIKRFLAAGIQIDGLSVARETVQHKITKEDVRDTVLKVAAGTPTVVPGDGDRTSAWDADNEELAVTASSDDTENDALDGSEASEMYARLSEENPRALDVLQRYFLWSAQMLFAEDDEGKHQLKVATAVKAAGTSAGAAIAKKMQILRDKKGAKWVYAGYMDFGHTGAGRSTFGQPLRIVNYAWNASVCDVEGFWGSVAFDDTGDGNGTQYDASGFKSTSNSTHINWRKVNEMIENFDIIEFGLQNMGNFFQIKDRDNKEGGTLWMIRQEQREAVHDMAILNRLYKKGPEAVENARRSFAVFEQMANMLQSDLITSMLLGETDDSTYWHNLEKTMNFYTEMQECGILYPRSFVKKVQDAFLRRKRHYYTQKDLTDKDRGIFTEEHLHNVEFDEKNKSQFGIVYREYNYIHPNSVPNAVIQNCLSMFMGETPQEQYQYLLDKLNDAKWTIRYVSQAEKYERSEKWDIEYSLTDKYDKQYNTEHAEEFEELQRLEEAARKSYGQSAERSEYIKKRDEYYGHRETWVKAKVQQELMQIQQKFNTVFSSVKRKTPLYLAQADYTRIYLENLFMIQAAGIYAYNPYSAESRYDYSEGSFWTVARFYYSIVTGLPFYPKVRATKEEDKPRVQWLKDESTMLAKEVTADGVFTNYPWCLQSFFPYSNAGSTSYNRHGKATPLQMATVDETIYSNYSFTVQKRSTFNDCFVQSEMPVADIQKRIVMLSEIQRLLDIFKTSYPDKYVTDIGRQPSNYDCMDFSDFVVGKGMPKPKFTIDFGDSVGLGTIEGILAKLKEIDTKMVQLASEYATYCDETKAQKEKERQELRERLEAEKAERERQMEEAAAGTWETMLKEYGFEDGSTKTLFSLQTDMVLKEYEYIIKTYGEEDVRSWITEGNKKSYSANPMDVRATVTRYGGTSASTRQHEVLRNGLLYVIKHCVGEEEAKRKQAEQEELAAKQAEQLAAQAVSCDALWDKCSAGYLNNEDIFAFAPIEQFCMMLGYKAKTNSSLFKVMESKSDAYKPIIATIQKDGKKLKLTQKEQQAVDYGMVVCMRYLHREFRSIYPAEQRKAIIDAGIQVMNDLTAELQDKKAFDKVDLLKRYDMDKCLNFISHALEIKAVYAYLIAKKRSKAIAVFDTVQCYARYKAVPIGDNGFDTEGSRFPSDGQKGHIQNLFVDIVEFMLNNLQAGKTAFGGGTAGGTGTTAPKSGTTSKVSFVTPKKTQAEPQTTPQAQPEQPSVQSEPQTQPEQQIAQQTQPEQTVESSASDAEPTPTEAKTDDEQVSEPVTSNEEGVSTMPENTTEKKDLSTKGAINATATVKPVSEATVTPVSDTTAKVTKVVPNDTATVTSNGMKVTPI